MLSKKHTPNCLRLINCIMFSNQQGGFQVYIRISHLVGENPDFDSPFDDPLIDEAFLEFQLPAVTFENRLTPSTQILIENGEFNRIRVDLQTSVHCAEGYNGTGCEIICDPQCRSGIILWFKEIIDLSTYPFPLYI